MFWISNILHKSPAAFFNSCIRVCPSSWLIFDFYSFLALRFLRYASLLMLSLFCHAQLALRSPVCYSVKGFPRSFQAGYMAISKGLDTIRVSCSTSTAIAVHATQGRQRSCIAELTYMTSRPIPHLCFHEIIEIPILVF